MNKLSTKAKQQTEVERDLAATYNRFKEFEGKQSPGVVFYRLAIHLYNYKKRRES